MKEWTTPDCRNTPSNINVEEEEIVDAPRNDRSASMPEQVKRPNPWKKMMMNDGIGEGKVISNGVENDST